MKLKLILSVSIQLILIASAIYGFYTLSTTLKGDNLEPCWQYINSSNGVLYLFGRCYIPEYHYYETNKECGFLGISCYETSEPYWVEHTTTKCIVAKTGELC